MAFDEDRRIPDVGWPQSLWRMVCESGSSTAAKVAAMLARIELGNLASLKSLGEGVLESRIDWGSGYRLYLGREGGELVILLAGGTKQRQQRDIEAAQARWRDYKSRRKN